MGVYMAARFNEPLFVISVAARLVEMHPQTLRKYEREGLIAPSRTQGNLRLYSDRDIEQLRQVKYLVEDRGLNLAGVQLALELTQRLRLLRERAENRRLQSRNATQNGHEASWKGSSRSLDSSRNALTRSGADSGDSRFKYLPRLQNSRQCPAASGRVTHGHKSTIHRESAGGDPACAATNRQSEALAVRAGGHPPGSAEPVRWNRATGAPEGGDRSAAGTHGYHIRSRTAAETSVQRRGGCQPGNAEAA